MKIERLQNLKKQADKQTGFSEKALQVFTAKGYNQQDIEEAKQVIREAWADPVLKDLWIEWINSEHSKGWR